MYVILEYTQEDFARMEERAFINSRSIGEYIRKLIEYPCDKFVSWQTTETLAEKPKALKPKRKRRTRRIKKGA